MSSEVSLTELANGAAGLMAVLSGLLAGGARSLAVISGVPSEAVDRTTAIGFIFGILIAVVVLGIDIRMR